MPDNKIEVGKTYRTKNGLDAVVVAQLTNVISGPRTVVFLGYTINSSKTSITPMSWDDEGNWYTANGPSKDHSIELATPGQVLYEKLTNPTDRGAAVQAATAYKVCTFNALKNGILKSLGDLLPHTVGQDTEKAKQLIDYIIEKGFA